MDGSRWVIFRFVVLFFFNDTATTEIYTLSLHDAHPISWGKRLAERRPPARRPCLFQLAFKIMQRRRAGGRDRKSTRLNSSHSQISYAVFCLKKKNDTNRTAKPTRARGTHCRKPAGYALA